MALNKAVRRTSRPVIAPCIARGPLFDDTQRRRLYANIAAAMEGVPEEIVNHRLALFAKIEPRYLKES